MRSKAPVPGRTVGNPWYSDLRSLVLLLPTFLIGLAWLVLGAVRGRETESEG
jgi:hypothetical protein